MNAPEWRTIKRRARLHTLLAFACVCVLVPVGMRIRARLLPDVDVPILHYERISRHAADAGTVPLDLFHTQMGDLASNGFRTFAPWRLWAYQTWGIPLPEKPVLITFDYAYRNLLTDVAPILREQNLTAIVFLATTYISSRPGESHALNGEPMMTWREVEAAMKEGVFRFGGHTRNLVDLTRHVNPFNEIRASRSDIKRATGVRSRLFSYPHGRFTPDLAQAARRAKIWIAMTQERAVATIGPRSDLLALPRIRVVGGHHAFRVGIVERHAPGVFGEVVVSHPGGPAFPCVIHVYGVDDTDPLATHVSDGFSGDESVAFVLPADVKFPVDIEILDEHRILLYHSVRLHRNAVRRDPDSSGVPVSLDFPLDLDELP